MWLCQLLVVICQLVMCVSALSLLAAVPIGIEDEPPPFWLTRIFGSGRRKRKSSRDIGTYITEGQLLLETPPSSPSYVRSPALPDLVTSCSPPPLSAASGVVAGPGGRRRHCCGPVFVFPDSSSSASSLPVAASASISPSLPQPTASERLQPVSVQQVQQPSAGRQPDCRPRPRQEEEQVVAENRSSESLSVDRGVPRREIRDMATALRACADQLQLQRQLRLQEQQLQLGQNRSERLSKLLTACCVFCVAAGCVCRMWSSN